MPRARLDTRRPWPRRAVLGGLGAAGAAAALAGGLTALPPAGPARAAEVMTPTTALERARAGDLLLLDIRRPSEWRETGVPAPARELTMHHETGPRGFLEEVLAAVDGDRARPVALICAAGVRTTWASRFLDANGFETVYNVKEGVLGRGEDTGWIARGLPMRDCASCAAAE